MVVQIEKDKLLNKDDFILNDNKILVEPTIQVSQISNETITAKDHHRVEIGGGMDGIPDIFATFKYFIDDIVINPLQSPLYDFYYLNNKRKSSTSFDKYLTSEKRDNLITEQFYYDGLISVESFMKIVNVDYSVLDSELLVLDSNINDEDFFNYQEITENKYIRNIPFEQVFSENKSKKISLENQDTNNVYKDFSSIEKECIKSNNKLTEKNNWKNIFDTNAQEIVLQGSPYCNYFALIYILKRVKNVEENISFIKNTLIKAYKELISDPKCSLAIQNILKKQDKKIYVNKIIKKQLSYDAMILNENYNLTHLDVWVFCNYMNLPVILFSDISDKSSHMKIYNDMQVKTNHIVLGGDVENDSFIFLKSNHIQSGDINFISFSIITPGLKINEINNLTIIKKDLKESLQSFKIKLKIKNELPK